MKLIMIHGVAQGGAQGDPEEIAGNWTRAMIVGGVRLAALTAAEPRLAWYGNLLDAKGQTDFTAAMVKPGPLETKFLLTTAAQVNAASGLLLERALNSMRVDPASLSSIRIVPRLAGGRQPFSLGEVLEGLVDVFQYLRNKTLRDRIDDKVAESFSESPQTIVAHSLGSVIAYRLLRDRKIACRRLVTIGSPLVFASVRNLLDGPFSWPTNLSEWRNFYDPDDPICLGSPFPHHPSWSPRIAQQAVNDIEGHGHRLEGYLAELPVGAAIDAML